MMNLQTFQARFGQLDILSVAEANAAIGGGRCNKVEEIKKVEEVEEIEQRRLLPTTFVLVVG